MSPTEVFTAVSTFGLATVLLLGLLWGLYKLGRLLIEKVAVPVGNAHVNFLNTTSDNLQKVSANMEALGKKIDGVCKATCCEQQKGKP